MKMAFWIFLSVLGTLVIFLAWASYPWSLNHGSHLAEVVTVETDEMMDVPEFPSVIKVLTFNIGFLYGEGSEGQGYSHRGVDFYKKGLEKISSEIKDWGADVVCLQEIDFDSSRSGHVNQAQFIAKRAGYPYVAEAVSWNAHYIPFPYWPIKNNFGAMKSGGAVLSKFPILRNEVTLLQKPLSQPWWYNLFYLHRYFQEVTVSAGEKNFNVVNLHLEAFDKVDRRSQILALVQKIRQGQVDLVTGDFNMLPKSAAKRTRFVKSTDEYENDPSYELMQGSGLSEVIPDEIYALDEARYFTYPAWAPDRRLDYIWYKTGLKMMKAEVLPSASSDHLPLRASFQIDGPRFNPYSQ